MGPWRTSVYQVSHFSSNCPWSGFNLKCITAWGLWGPLPSLPPSFSFSPLVLALCEQGNNSSLAFPTSRERHRKGTAGNFLATLNLPGELHSPFPRQTGWRCTPWGVCLWRRGEGGISLGKMHSHNVQYIRKRQGRTEWMTLWLHYAALCRTVLLPHRERF